MYDSFFGFSEKPFDVTPDPTFLYLSPGHRETLAALLYGIRERRGFIAIVGEVGTGKTTLINTVLNRLDEKTKVAYLFNTEMNFYQLLIMALSEFDLVIPDERITKVEALQRLNDFAVAQLAEGNNVVLIVDEAQNLNRRAMENLRLLSNLETQKHKLIQIVLSGQPELDTNLHKPELRQLKQRISLKRYILPLSEKETYEYIQHRLDIANYRGPALFPRSAKKLIWEYSGGVPRKINILCDNALLIGFAERKKRIRKTLIEEAVMDLDWSPLSSPGYNLESQPEMPIFGRRQGFRFRSGFLVTAGLVLAIFLALAFASRDLPFGFETDGVTDRVQSFLGSHQVDDEQTPSGSAGESDPPPRVMRGDVEIPESVDVRAPENGFRNPPPEPETAASENGADKTGSSGRPWSFGYRPVSNDADPGKDIDARLLNAVEGAAATSGNPLPRAEGGNLVVTIRSLAVETRNALSSRRLLSDEDPEDPNRRSAPSFGPEPTRDEAVSFAEPSGEKRDAVIEGSDFSPEVSGDAVAGRSGFKNTDRLSGRKRIVVRKGDFLSTIITRVYGDYDEAKLNALIRENPEIKNPDFLDVGQILILPAASEAKE